MYNIIKIGIPIQSIDISSEFLNAIEDIKNGNSIGITTVDYFDNPIENFTHHIDTISSPAGHRVIFNNLKLQRFDGNTFINNSINTLGSLWSEVSFRNKTELITKLLSIIDKQHELIQFKNVYIFSTGSPYFMDFFMEVIPKYREVQVIDTRSSFDICIDAMHKSLGYKPEPVVRRYNSEFILGNNFNIDLKKLNIFSCISNIYKWNIDIPMVDHFFNTMDKLVDSDSIFFLVTVSEADVILKKLKYSEAEMFYKKEMQNPSIIGIHKGQL